MKILALITGLFLVSFLMCQAGIAGIPGTWKGTLKTPDGSDFPLVYILQVDGNKLTGTGLAPQGTVELSDGKITGNDFSFTMPVPPEQVMHTGKYYAQGDSIGINITFNGNDMHSTLLRSK